jgi:hypothetical protein
MPTMTANTNSSAGSRVAGAAVVGPVEGHAPAPSGAPTIRRVIVCVPDAIPGSDFDRRQLDRHFGVPGSIAQHFWAKPCRRWQRGRLVDLRKGTPAPCAGGPLRLLDLEALRHAHRVGAAMRHQMFTAATRGTRDAKSWPVFLQRHLDDPARYPYTTAEADFCNQPRVLVLAAHNAVTADPAGQLDPHELEMFQAGPAAYGNYRYLYAAVADAVLGLHGDRLAPATARFADRLAYLHHANRYLDGLDPDCTLIAVDV